MTGKELWYIAQAHAAGHLAGDGAFTKQCQAWAEFYSQMDQAPSLSDLATAGSFH